MGFAYWLYCVAVIHEVLRAATRGEHPISPAKAVLYHFLPLYHLYWVFSWPNEIVRFAKRQNPSLQISYKVPGLMILAGSALCRVDGALGMVAIFAALLLVSSHLRAASARISGTASPTR